jgi:hypothetical protein
MLTGGRPSILRLPETDRPRLQRPGVLHLVGVVHLRPEHGGLHEADALLVLLVMEHLASYGVNDITSQIIM